LTNFPNDKQTQESLESDFPETTFRETNMALELEIWVEHWTLSGLQDRFRLLFFCAIIWTWKRSFWILDSAWKF
jgi:hypothetical protein